MLGCLQLVPAVTELLIGEILYLQYRDKSKPMFMYINSTGTSRADGETVGFHHSFGLGLHADSDRVTLYLVLTPAGWI